jgi:hypothetical protein
LAMAIGKFKDCLSKIYIPNFNRISDAKLDIALSKAPMLCCKTTLSINLIIKPFIQSHITFISLFSL